VPAKEYTCKVTALKWLTPTVIDLRFEPSKKFSFEPGQFLSVVVPAPAGSRKPLRRAYSLAIPPEEGFGLCVKVVPGGPGSNYVASLKVGDPFKAFAPYGDFVYDHASTRNVCFVSTGTGVAPLLSMIRARAFRDNPPPHALSLFGARTQDEIIYPGFFASLGLVEVNAISNPTSGFRGFEGRVTDYLKSLPAEWAWGQTDFYICGNGEMVADVVKLLRGRGVPQEQIHKEIYFVAPDRLKQAPAEPPKVVPPPLPAVKIVMPPPFKKKVA
jgi:CDP-4-dehydro-6-deoxyglucose reductase